MGGGREEANVQCELWVVHVSPAKDYGVGLVIALEHFLFVLVEAYDRDQQECGDCQFNEQCQNVAYEITNVKENHKGAVVAVHYSSTNVIDQKLTTLWWE